MPARRLLAAAGIAAATLLTGTAPAVDASAAPAALPRPAAADADCLRGGGVWLQVAGVGGGCASSSTGERAITSVFGAGAITKSNTGLICGIAGFPGGDLCRKGGFDYTTQQYLVYWHYYPCETFPSGYSYRGTSAACNSWNYSQEGAETYVAPPGSIEYWHFATTETGPSYAPPSLAIAPPPVTTTQAPPPPPPTTSAPEPPAPTAPTAPAPAAPAPEPTKPNPTATAPGTSPTEAATSASVPASSTSSAAVDDGATPSPTAPSATTGAPTPAASAASSAPGSTSARPASTSAAARSTNPVPSTGRAEGGTGSPVATLATLGILAAVGAGGAGWWWWNRRKA